ncbi:MAG: hypothetical protein JSV09_02280 [Thermoplasmata archaeon]|nr:MAG: hypothetical protein JSV09_02280 [Thermoplasmata archaeon]
MKQDKLITKWNGLLPIVEDMPMQEIIWDKMSYYMHMVRDMGCEESEEAIGV